MNNKVELVTVYRGNDSATYLLKEFVEFGDNATPLRIRQNPTENSPYKKMKLIDADGIRKFYEEPIEQGNDLGKWDVKVLRKLLKSAPKEK